MPDNPSWKLGSCAKSHLLGRTSGSEVTGRESLVTSSVMPTVKTRLGAEDIKFSNTASTCALRVDGFGFRVDGFGIRGDGCGFRVWSTSGFETLQSSNGVSAHAPSAPLTAACFHCWMLTCPGVKSLPPRPYLPPMTLMSEFPLCQQSQCLSVECTRKTGCFSD